MNYIEHLFINFVFKNKIDSFKEFISSFKEEINSLKKHYSLKIKTIYIATSELSNLTCLQLKSFLILLNSFISKDLIEYSFEIGQQTLKEKQLEILKKFNINRLVWKIKTFNNKKSTNLINLIKKSQNLGFQNFSIDLEYNIPNQSKKNIINDLNISLALNAPHISYQSSSDSHNYQKKIIINNFLKQHNYQNYEFFSYSISKKNYCQHTLGYLNLKNWYGAGPNSNSFLKTNTKKINIVNNSTIPWTSKKEELSINMYYQLLIIQGLVIKKGILLENEQLDAVNYFSLIIKKLIANKKIEIKNNYLKTTQKGWNLLDNILIDFINQTNQQ